MVGSFADPLTTCPTHSFFTCAAPSAWMGIFRLVRPKESYPLSPQQPFGDMVTDERLFCFSVLSAFYHANGSPCERPGFTRSYRWQPVQGSLVSPRHALEGFCRPRSVAVLIARGEADPRPPLRLRKIGGGQFLADNVSNFSSLGIPSGHYPTLFKPGRAVRSDAYAVDTGRSDGACCLRLQMLGGVRWVCLELFLQPWGLC